MNYASGKTNKLVITALILGCWLRVELSAQPAKADTSPPHLQINEPEDITPWFGPTPTPTPNATPTPTPPCPYKKGTMSFEGWNQDANANYSNPFAGSDTTNSCVSQWINKIKTTTKQNDPTGTTYQDDRWARNAAELLFGGRAKITVPLSNVPGIDDLYHLNQTLPNGAYCQDTAAHHFDRPNWWMSSTATTATIQEHCISGYFYFDAGCNIVPKSTVTANASCGSEPEIDFNFHFIKSSPISLLWTPDADIENNAVASTFPLNPEEHSKWYAWRASEKTPLLVYDPLHTGRITSAEQLFGNWTFGGQRTASLDSAAIGRPWKSGYDALKTLDRDGDGKISGSELAPLALWFDKNQDAISQPGEVRSATEMGITALFYTPDNKGASEQHIYASKGFEREVNGKIVSGGSVDWFAESANNPFELTAGIGRMNSVAGKAPKFDALDPVATTPAKVNTGPTVAGVWNWKFSDPRDNVGMAGNYPTRGVLVFSKAQDTSEIEGYSLVVMPFEKTRRNPAAGRGQMYYFHGTNDASNVSFSFKDGYSQMKTEAVLSADGQRMDGTSTALFDEGGGLKTLTYHWTAYRAN